MFGSLTGQNAILLLLAVAGIWFAARFVVAPKRGAPGLAVLGLGAMFSREAPAVPTPGLGKEAIASLLDDTRQFVSREPALRGLILAGPFAAMAADAQSKVTFVALAENPGLFAGKEWLRRWPYPARGHEVLDHAIEPNVLGTLHRFTLKGAPPVDFLFESLPSIHVPEVIAEAFEAGSETIEDPTGQIEKLRHAWLEQADRRRRRSA